MPPTDTNSDDSKQRLPAVDTLEKLAAVTLPTALGAGAAAASGTTSLGVGLASGAAIGWKLRSVRRQYVAVRTSDGIERRRRPFEETWWGRAADWEYDKRYDYVLAVVLAVVGVGAFAAIPFVEVGDGTVPLNLTLVGLGAVTASLMTCASLSLRS